MSACRRSSTNQRREYFGPSLLRIRWRVHIGKIGLDTRGIENSVWQRYGVWHSEYRRTRQRQFGDHRHLLVLSTLRLYPQLKNSNNRQLKVTKSWGRSSVELLAFEASSKPNFITFHQSDESRSHLFRNVENLSKEVFDLTHTTKVSLFD